MLTLYHSPQSRSSRFVWLLEELGQPYEIEYVAIRRGDGAREVGDAGLWQGLGQWAALNRRNICSTPGPGLKPWAARPGGRFGRSGILAWRARNEAVTGCLDYRQLGKMAYI